MWIKFRFVVIVGFLFCGSKSIAGYRSDFLIPQTHTLDTGEWQVAVERRAVFLKEETDPVGYGHQSNLGLSFGIWDYGPVAVEGGTDWLEPSAGSMGRSVFGHLRVRFNRLSEMGWSVATGIENLGFVTNKNDVNYIYVTLQNKIGELWTVGAGAYSGNSRFLVDHRGKPDAKGMFVGVWRQVQRGLGRVGLEYQTGLNQFGFMFVGTTLELAEGILGTLGYGFANDQQLVRDSALARISADF